MKCNITHLNAQADDLIERTRKKWMKQTIKRPGTVGTMDEHGHMWYCFDEKCQPAHKNHRSFNSHKAMLQHLNARHTKELDSVVEEEHKEWQSILNGFW